MQCEHGKIPTSAMPAYCLETQCIMTMLSILTTWRRNAMTIDMAEVMMSHVPMYSVTTDSGFQPQI